MNPPPATPADLPAPRAATRIWPVILLVGAAIGAAILATWNILNALAELNTMTDRRAQARNARIELLETLSQFKDLETGMRGFVISGRADYLEPYHTARATLPGAYARAKSRIGDNLPVGFNWTRLDELVELRQDLAARAIDDRMRRGAGVIDERALFDEGKSVMDEIRVIIQLLDTHLQREIQARDQAVKAARQRAEQINLGLFVTTLALLMIAIVLTLRERRLRLALEGQLREINTDLESRVAQRTADLAVSERRIAAFATEQVRAIEQERRRVAREVHDQIGQVFTAIKLILQSLPRQALNAAQTAALDQAIETGIVTARRITADLRPPLLDDLGLAAALQHLVGSLPQAASIDFTVALRNEALLSEEQALGLFRVVQEVLTNILRHAQAHAVAIEGGAEAGRYRLRIRDDGKGFDPGRVRTGSHGLANMRERSVLMQGSFSIETALHGGTEIVIELPLEANEHDEHPAA